MAKGNMLLGMARGSVGDVTFYRDGGLQRARSRNRQPNNPRSNKQQTQRALFANCVKFYKLTAAKFYKFAFENKKVNESDYNAFMRENLKRGVMISKTAFYTEAYPALGNWLMSRGSLATIVNANGSNTDSPVFDFGAAYSATPSASTTISEMSTAMVASGRYQVGDIITMVKYLADGDNIPTATPNAETDYLQTNFVFWQFLVDPNNDATLASVFGDLPRFYAVKTSQNTLAIKLGVDAESANEEWRLGYTSATVIHSRNTSSGLRVSTQELTLNPRMTQAIETAATDANYKSAVLTDWQSSGIAILQGDGLELEEPLSVLKLANDSAPTTRTYEGGAETQQHIFPVTFNKDAAVVTSEDFVISNDTATTTASWNSSTGEVTFTSTAPTDGTHYTVYFREQKILDVNFS